MSRPLLYLIAPYRYRTGADEERLIAAKHHALELGWAPVFAPDSLAGVLDDDVAAEREVALECALSLLEVCHEAAVVGARMSDGMRLEVQRWEWSRLRPPVPIAELGSPGFD